MNKRYVRKMNVWASVDPAAPATGTAPPAPPAAPAAAAAPPAAELEKQVSQTQVNAIVARERQAAQEKATADLAKQLGVTVEEATTIIKAHTDKANSEKSDAVKAREAADKEVAEAKTVKAEAAQEKHNTWADRELLKAGVSLPEKEQDQDPALARIRGLLTVQVGATAAEIAADVKAVKELYPALFGGKVGGTTSPPGSDPNARGGGGPGTEGKTGIAAGMERARLQYEKKENNRPLPAGQRKT